MWKIDWIEKRIKNNMLACRAIPGTQNPIAICIVYKTLLKSYVCVCNVTEIYIPLRFALKFLLNRVIESPFMHSCHTF